MPRDEAEELRVDRRRFRLHAATFGGGVLGGPLILVLMGGRMLPELVGLVVLVLAAISLVVSGVFAVRLGRTCFTPQADPELGGLDPYEQDSDALVTGGLWTLDLAPNLTRSTAPYAVLAVGVLFLGATSWWLIAALMP